MSTTLNFRKRSVRVTALERHLDKQDEQAELLRDFIAEVLSPFMDHQKRKVDIAALPEEIQKILKDLPVDINPGE